MVITYSARGIGISIHWDKTRNGPRPRPSFPVAKGWDIDIRRPSRPRPRGGPHAGPAKPPGRPGYEPAGSGCLDGTFPQAPWIGDHDIDTGLAMGCARSKAESRTAMPAYVHGHVRCCQHDPAAARALQPGWSPDPPQRDPRSGLCPLGVQAEFSS